MKIIKRKNLLQKGSNIPCPKTITILAVLAILALIPFIKIHKPQADIINSSPANVSYKINFGNLQIIDIKTNKLRDIYTSWDIINFTIQTNGAKWAIKILPANNLLKFEKNTVLTQSWIDLYTVQALSIKPWREYVAFVDWQNSLIKEIGILPKDIQPLWVKIEWPSKLMLNQSNSYNLYFINILWYKEEINLKWNIDIALLKNGKILDKQTINIPYSTYQEAINFRPQITGEYQLAIILQRNWKKYISVKNIVIY